MLHFIKKISVLGVKAPVAFDDEYRNIRLGAAVSNTSSLGVILAHQPFNLARRWCFHVKDEM